MRGAGDKAALGGEQLAPGLDQLRVHESGGK
jgi:hypothetical protein